MQEEAQKNKSKKEKQVLNYRRYPQLKGIAAIPI